MRWLDATPRRAAPKGHETFILRAASTSSHRLLQRRLLSAHAAQNTTDLRLFGVVWSLDLWFSWVACGGLPLAGAPGRRLWGWSPPSPGASCLLICLAVVFPAPHRRLRRLE